MSGECDKWSWQLSGYDKRVHAFVHPDQVAAFVEAACSHSVPCDRVTLADEGARCLACLLIVGDHLADHHQIGVRF
jgi:hypothetical protein